MNDEHRRALPRHRRHEERARDLAKIANILLTTGASQPIEAGGVVLPGDAQVLRCIPVCTRGVAAVIPGTNPLTALIAAETRLERLRLRL